MTRGDRASKTSGVCINKKRILYAKFNLLVTSSMVLPDLRHRALSKIPTKYVTVGTTRNG